MHSPMDDRAGPNDLARPNSARIYDYWLKGKDSYPLDRMIADDVSALAPWAIAAARANRAFLRRAVAWLAGAGIDQFIDVGCGLPTLNNTHEVAQRLTPRARVVYIDNDPVVLAHARALLGGQRDVLVVHGDARDPFGILTSPSAWTHLDLCRPIAVLFGAVLHFLTAADDAAGAVAAFRDILSPGSHVVISHASNQESDPRADAIRDAAGLYDAKVAPVHLRTPGQIAALFDGFGLLPPGLVDVDSWRRRSGGHRAAPPPVLGGVGRLLSDRPAAP